MVLGDPWTFPSGEVRRGAWFTAVVLGGNRVQRHSTQDQTRDQTTIAQHEDDGGEGRVAGRPESLWAGAEGRPRRRQTVRGVSRIVFRLRGEPLGSW